MRNRCPAVAGLLTVLSLLAAFSVYAQPAPFTPQAVFEIEYPSDVQISPDGESVVYVRNSMSIMRDRREGRLWLIGADGSGHRKVTSDDRAESSPRWAPDSSRIAFVSADENGGGSEIYVTWTDTGQTARLTQLERTPSELAWSPDGSQIAFSMLVPGDRPVIATLPKAPDGAEWASPPIVETRVRHEEDGVGVIEPGFEHIFVVPADGGTARQVTSGNYHDSDPVWSADGESILFSSNRRHEWEFDVAQSDVFRVSLDDGDTVQLTDRIGPDEGQEVSPDGGTIAYTGFEDRERTYQTSHLHIMNANGSQKRQLLPQLDRSVFDLIWAADGSGIYFAFEDQGLSKVGLTLLDGDWRVVAQGIGGSDVGRPYGRRGNYSVSDNGLIAFPLTKSDEPGEVAIAARDGSVQVITDLNGDLKKSIQFASAEMIWTESSHDGLVIQSWVLHPPGFDVDAQYPLLLEIHGGPTLNYGDRFSAEMQLYAAAGYVVVYSNPRGSTGYGETFGDLLYHDYPGNDYDDLISVIDAVIERGYIDEDQLYVTGASAGGIMTAWIVGHSNRFRAAVATAPIANWISKTLVADNYNGYSDRRYPGTALENPDVYWDFSPLSVVENVETPTMVMVGEADLRAPLSEAKQLYHALKLRRVDTALVTIPDAFHNIAARPSQLIAKAIYALGWFEQYGE